MWFWSVQNAVTATQSWLLVLGDQSHSWVMVGATFPESPKVGAVAKGGSR
jgi:hypothetical protein